jgi:tRNA threonylcarbamoyladenosine biosynthesis protein TsaE
VKTVEVLSASAEDTERAAATVAEALEPGDVVLVSGDVGTGKTTFVRGACRALRVAGRVTSPSFTIGHRYEGAIPVSHIDLYRLETLENEDPALLDDYLSLDSVAFIEWPDAARAAVEPERVALRVRLAHLGTDQRLVRASGRGVLVERLRSTLPSNGAR